MRWGPGTEKSTEVQPKHAIMQPMIWRDFEVFLAVFRAQSHAGAARMLGVDATTVGRRLAALEAGLGVRLIDRTADALVLTPAGQTVIPRAERIEAELLATAREIEGADQSVAGTVRVTASDGFTHFVLIPALAALRQEHPGLAIELRADSKLLDLSRREADVAVRLVKPKEPALVARRIGSMAFGLYGSSSYLERRGIPTNLRALTAHDWVGFDSAWDSLPQQRWLLQTVPNPRFALRATSTTAQSLACGAGLGLALLPCFVEEGEPRLVRVLPQLAVPSREIWVACHGDLKKNRRVSLVRGWIESLWRERSQVS